MFEEISGTTVSKFAENKAEIMFIQCHYLNGLNVMLFYYTNQIKSQCLPQRLESCSDTWGLKGLLSDSWRWASVLMASIFRSRQAYKSLYNLQPLDIHLIDTSHPKKILKNDNWSIDTQSYGCISYLPPAEQRYAWSAQRKELRNSLLHRWADSEHVPKF